MANEKDQNKVTAVEMQPEETEEGIDPIYFDIFGRNVTDEEAVRIGEEGFKELLEKMG